MTKQTETVTVTEVHEVGHEVGQDDGQAHQGQAHGGQAPGVCDGASVGVLIRDEAGRWLMFERVRPPHGVAPAAGHVFDDHAVDHTAGQAVGESVAPAVAAVEVEDWSSWEAAARAEVAEELGLTVQSLTDTWLGGWRTNACRRGPGPDGRVGHYWRIYTATVSGDLAPAPGEARNVRWLTSAQLQELATLTVDYACGLVDEDDWIAGPGIEPVWLRWLVELGLVTVSRGDLMLVDHVASTGHGPRPPRPSTSPTPTSKPQERQEQGHPGCVHPLAHHDQQGCTVDWVWVDGITVVTGCPCPASGPLVVDLGWYDDGQDDDGQDLLDEGRGLAAGPEPTLGKDAGEDVGEDVEQVREQLKLARQLTRDADAKASGLLSGVGVLAAVGAVAAAMAPAGSGPARAVVVVGGVVLAVAVMTALMTLLAVLVPRGGRPWWLVDPYEPVTELDRVKVIVDVKHHLLRVAVLALQVAVLVGAGVVVALVGAR